MTAEASWTPGGTWPRRAARRDSPGIVQVCPGNPARQESVRARGARAAVVKRLVVGVARLGYHHHQSRLRRMAERIWRRQDDDDAARSADPPLRYHRDRQRQLALQKPWLIFPALKPPERGREQTWGVAGHRPTPKKPTSELPTRSFFRRQADFAASDPSARGIGEIVFVSTVRSVTACSPPSQGVAWQRRSLPHSRSDGQP